MSRLQKWFPCSRSCQFHLLRPEYRTILANLRIHRCIRVAGFARAAEADADAAGHFSFQRKLARNARFICEALHRCQHWRWSAGCDAVTVLDGVEIRADESLFAKAAVFCRIKQTHVFLCVRFQPGKLRRTATADDEREAVALGEQRVGEIFKRRLADAAAESSRTREELALYERPDGDASGEEEE